MGKFFKMPLHKRYSRQLRSNAGRFIGVFLILVAILGGCLGMYLSSVDGLANYKNILKEQKAQDGFFASFSQLKDISEIEDKVGGIKIESAIYVDDQIKDAVNLRLYDERKSQDLPYVEKGKLPGRGQIFIEKNFARVHKFGLGDKIDFAGKTYEISGTGLLPDYIDPREDLSDFMSESKHFGVGTLSAGDFDKISKSKYNYTYSYRVDDRNISQKKEDAKLRTLKEEVSKQTILSSVVTKENNPRVSGPDQKIETVNQSVVLFIFIGLLIVIFILVSYSKHIIKQETPVIGLMFASGYRKKEIALHYAVLPTLVTMVGSFVAGILGYKVFAGVFFKTYLYYYSIPNVDFGLNWKVVGLMTILPAILIALVMVFYASRLLRFKAVDMLRNDVGKKKKTSRIKLRSKNFAFKFRMRLFLNSKSNFARLFIGIFLSTFMLMFALGMPTTFTHYTKAVMDNSKFHYTYVLKAPIEPENDVYYEKVSSKQMRIEIKNDKADANKTIDLLGVSPDSKYFKPSKGKFPEGEKELAISSSMNLKFKFGVGDKIRAYDSVEDKWRTFRISGIIPYELGQMFFMDRETLNDMVDYPDDFYTMLFSDKKLDLEEDYVTTVMNRENLSSSSKAMWEFMKSLVFAMSAVGIICYLCLIYLLTGLSLEEHRNDISLAKIIGYRKREIESLYLRQNLIAVIASILVSLPLVRMMLEVYWYKMMAHTTGWISFVPSPRVYVSIFVIGLVAYVLVNFMHKRKIYRIPETEALKVRE